MCRTRANESSARRCLTASAAASFARANGVPAIDPLRSNTTQNAAGVDRLDGWGSAARSSVISIS